MTAPAKRARDPIDYHDVMLALGKAKAARLLLIAANSGSDYIQLPAGLLSDEEKAVAMGWIQHIAEGALEEALEDAEAAFRQSMTPEDAAGSRTGRDLP